MRPSRITRLEGEDLASFLEKEKYELDRKAQFAEAHRIREEFQSLQHVRDAQAISWAIETDIKNIINRLAPSEWAEFRKRLET